MKKKILVLIGAILMLIVVACGNNATKEKNDDKKAEETVQNEMNDETAEDDVLVEEPKAPEDDVQDDDTEILEDKGQSNDKPIESTEGEVNNREENNNNGNTTSNVPTPNAPTPSTPTPSTPTPSAPTHEHIWEYEHKDYEIIKNYINGCNGCGYPLFTIGESGASHIENLYFHPPCYSERFEGDCTGGGFHSESFTSGYCYSCGGKVSYRQCMWTEMGKRCSKNEVLGAYKKVVFGDNFFMYYDVCDCGENTIACGEKGGIVLLRKVCSICGAVEK